MIATRELKLTLPVTMSRRLTTSNYRVYPVGWRKSTLRDELDPKLTRRD